MCKHQNPLAPRHKLIHTYFCVFLQTPPHTVFLCVPIPVLSIPPFSIAMKLNRFYEFIIVFLCAVRASCNNHVMQMCAAVKGGRKSSETTQEKRKRGKTRERNCDRDKFMWLALLCYMRLCLFQIVQKFSTRIEWKI